MKCLIIAAGKGTRLRRKGEVKPLVPILGVPLIERVIRTAMEGGADDFYVVLGYKAKKIETFLTLLMQTLNIPITIIQNDNWEKENGYSVLKAKEFISEPFILLMSDHLFNPSIIKSMRSYSLQNGEVLLAVDTNTSNPLVDMDDVTKVKFENSYISNIGKSIDDFNGFDTGIFYCTPAIFNALEDSQKMNNDTTLSGAIRHLADKKRAKVHKIEKFWIDIDDETAFKKAKGKLLETLKSKTNDGPVSRWLNRPVSIRCSIWLVNYNITPNQISFFSFLLSLVAAVFFATGEYLYLLVGGILAQFASIIDGSDGEVARLKYLSSEYGGWFDAVLDRYADAFLLFGLTWYVYIQDNAPLVLIIGFSAIIGSFMLSYTADKYDKLMKNRINKGIRLGRDVRVFLIFLGAIFNLPYLVLAVIAIVMNIETIRRIIICRDKNG
jgi:CDP-L-myo-inositol myo-inositolphosphotransferase